jgi:hypothetical protein
VQGLIAAPPRALQPRQGRRGGGANLAAPGSAGRRKVATLIAADAGLRLVENQLLTGTGPTPDTSPLSSTTFITASNGLATSFRTGEIASAAALPIMKVGGVVREGGQLNVGGSGTFSYGVYRSGVVAADPGGASVQLNAQWTVLEEGAGY